MAEHLTNEQRIVAKFCIKLEKKFTDNKHNLETVYWIHELGKASLGVLL